MLCSSLSPAIPTTTTATPTTASTPNRLPERPGNRQGHPRARPHLGRPLPHLPDKRQAAGPDIRRDKGRHCRGLLGQGGLRPARRAVSDDGGYEAVPRGGGGWRGPGAEGRHGVHVEEDPCGASVLRIQVSWLGGWEGLMWTLRAFTCESQSDAKCKPQSTSTSTTNHPHHLSPNQNPNQTRRYMGHVKFDIATKQLVSSRPVLLGGTSSSNPVPQDPAVLRAIAGMKGPVQALQGDVVGALVALVGWGLAGLVGGRCRLLGGLAPLHWRLRG